MSIGSFYDSKRLALSNEKLEYFRTLLNDWAERIPHHPYGKLGNACDILHVDHIPCHIIQVDAQLESRSLTEYREPYRRQVSPGTLPASSDLWSLTLHAVNGYETGNYKYTFGGPLEMCGNCSGHGKNKCQRCSSTGKIECSGCFGSGTDTCRYCRGTSQMDCTSCRGSGEIRERCPYCSAGTIYYQKICFNCRGAGGKCLTCFGSGTTKTSKRCNACNGSGFKTQLCNRCYRGKIQCTHCRHGKTQCSLCHGTGKRQCATCSGLGHIKCTSCDGNGQFIKYAIVSQELTHKKAYKKVHSKSLDKYKSFEPKTKQAALARPLFQLKQHAAEQRLGIGSDQIENAYASIISFLSNSPQQIQYHDTNIYEINCYVIKCSLNGRDFEMAIYGNDNKMMDYDSPIQTLKEDRYNRGKKYFEQNRFFESCEELKLAAEMDSTKENKYKAAFLMVRSHIYLPYTFGAVIGLCISLYLLPMEFPIIKSINTSKALQENEFPLLSFSAQCLLMIVAAYGIKRYLVARKGFSVKSDIKRFIYGSTLTIGVSLLICICFLLFYWGR